MIPGIHERLKGRCRWYDVIETSGSTVPVVFKNNRLYSVQEKENSGFGVRVNIEGKTGFSYTNMAGRITAAVDRAVDLARYGDEELFDLPDRAAATFEPYDPSIENFSVDAEIDRARTSIDRILSVFPGASVDVSINKSTGSMHLMNSLGLEASYRSSLYSAGISLTYVLESGSKIDIWEGISSLVPVDHLALVDRIIERTHKASSEKKCTAGTVPVFFTPKAVSRIMGIVASGFSAKAVWKGISPFAGKKGESLFNRKFSLCDDPILAGSPYSYPFDDEGVTAVKKNLVNCGTIENFVTDLKHAYKLGIPALGNGSRGYASLPSPSFSNTSIDAGEQPAADIIKSITRGILADQFIGLGQSNTLTGDFSANLDMAFLIENGEITGRVKDCMIADNLFRLLEGDVVMSSEREQNGSSLVPYILFPGINYTC